MTNWKEKEKEWNEKYDDMFDEFSATEAEAFYKRVEKRRKKSHDKKN
mgnify:FL=1